MWQPDTYCEACWRTAPVRAVLPAHTLCSRAQQVRSTAEGQWLAGRCGAGEEYSCHCRSRTDKAKLFLTQHIYYLRSGAPDLKTVVLLSYRLMINYSSMQPTAGASLHLGSVPPCMKSLAFIPHSPKCRDNGLTQASQTSVMCKPWRDNLNVDTVHLFQEILGRHWPVLSEYRNVKN
jgi:hypothetical protein